MAGAGTPGCPGGLSLVFIFSIGVGGRRAELLAGSYALAGGGWQRGHWVACVNGNIGVHPARRFPTRLPGGKWTLYWLLPPDGMVAFPTGWPSPATGVDRTSSQPVNSSSCREGIAVWRRWGFAVFRCSDWGMRVPRPFPRGLGAGTLDGRGGRGRPQRAVSCISR